MLRGWQIERDFGVRMASIVAIGDLIAISRSQWERDIGKDWENTRGDTWLAIEMSGHAWFR